MTLGLIEQKLFIGERLGEIDERVPQMPLARDLAQWQKKTRLKPEDLEQGVRVDMRANAGLLKSTLLHRLNLINVPWGRLAEAEAGPGTFRDVWIFRWVPELSKSVMSLAWMATSCSSSMQRGSTFTNGQRRGISRWFAAVEMTSTILLEPRATCNLCAEFRNGCAAVVFEWRSIQDFD